MLSHYSRLAKKPVQAAGVRCLAQVTNARVEPFLLEDMTQYKNGNEEELAPFVISRRRGFLPRKDPLVHLPETFSKVDSLLKRMIIHQTADSINGVQASGLLAKGEFGQAVKDELSATGRELKAVEEVIASGQTQLISALFRDYCFMTSAYLLEPVDISFRKTGFYDKGRDILPSQLAIPLKKLADALGHYPYMEYASSYALTNYQVKDQNYQGLAGKYSFDNMELIRSFEDASGSERGFILVHVEMVSYTGQLVDSVENALAAANCGDEKAFEAAFEKLLLTYRKINRSMDTMWSRSLPKDYLNYRSFIFGTGPSKMNALFPEGVTYEGVSEEPLFYRGESGANDSIVPTGDNLLEITAHMPNNELTKVLRDFRSYRPKNQKEYLAQLEGRASMVGIRSFAQRTPRAKALYILMVDQIREFRNRHWNFTKSYIIKQSSYDIATGGSPILTYLPQNLSIVLKVLEESYSEWSTSDESIMNNDKSTSHLITNRDLIQDVKEAGKRADAQRNILTREVEELVKEKEAKAKMAANEANSRGMLSDDDRMRVRGSIGNDGVG